MSADGAQHPVPCPGLSVDGISVRHIGGRALCSLADRIVVEPETSRVAGQAKHQALNGFKAGIGGAAIGLPHRVARVRSQCIVGLELTLFVVHGLCKISGCDSFYCSCERVFDPELARVPVIVLSNNDGCAIACRSAAKALGIRMGDPYDKIRNLCRVQGVRVFSSNYTLYGEMSGRTNAVCRQSSPQVEIGSVDESFLNLIDVAPGLRVELARDLRATVWAWTCIPTCVGIGPTRTLAKLANHIAKTVPDLGGVCDLTDPVAYAHWLCRIPVAEVWGIGRASLAKLEAMGVESVADLRDLDPRPDAPTVLLHADFCHSDLANALVLFKTLTNFSNGYAINFNKICR